MNKLFMKILWAVSDMGSIQSINLYKSGTFADVRVEVGGKLYKISMYEEEAEDEKND